MITEVIKINKKNPEKKLILKAADLIKNTNTFEKFYTTDERELFIRRLERKLDKNNLQVLENFLNMYANPVFNQMDKS